MPDSGTGTRPAPRSPGAQSARLVSALLDHQLLTGWISTRILGECVSLSEMKELTRDSRVGCVEVSPPSPAAKP
jgi:hypothetical protein